MGGEGKASVASPRDCRVRRWILRRVVDTAKQGELQCASSPVLPQARSEQAQHGGGGGGVPSIEAAGSTLPPPPPPSRAGHTPHVFWLVQCEVDLVDLSSGDGVRGYEEADSCKSTGVTAYCSRYPIPQELARPMSFLFGHPCLGTGVLQGLPYCPTTHIGTTLSQGDSKNI